jgi:UDP-N-acetyl-D-glucosamine dehydrogenase
VELTDDELSNADAVVIVTDHSAIDYQRVVDLARVVVDTRNATAGLSRRTTPGAHTQSADLAIAR